MRPKLPLKVPRIKSILAYADSDDPRALKAALLLARKMRARVKIVDVLEPFPLRVTMFNPADLPALVRTSKQDHLQKLAERWSTDSLKVHRELIEGQKDTAIILEVLKRDHSLLVINSSGDAGHRINSTGMRLLRQCPCPVWVAGVAPLKRRLRVLAAVDAVPDDPSRANLNAKVVSLANSIAQSCEGELHVLHAWHAYGEATLRGSYFGGSPAEVDRYVQETLLHHTQELESLLGRAQTAIPKNRLHLIKGEPETVISWFCKEKKVDVLVLGTIARTGLGAALIGNTAETLVSKVECSILAVKPDGFVCPVQTKS